MANVCMVGHGMMGIWHSTALARVPDARLHTVVGRARQPEAPDQARAGTAASSAGRNVDVVIIAGPSETHVEMSLAALEHGKHTLVEIPIGMNSRAPSGSSRPRRNADSPSGCRIRCGSGRRARGWPTASAKATSGCSTRTAGSTSTGYRMWAPPDCGGAGPTTSCGTTPHTLSTSGCSLCPAATCRRRTTGSVASTASIRRSSRAPAFQWRSSWWWRPWTRPIPTEQENAELIAPDFVDAVTNGREPRVPGGRCCRRCGCSTACRSSGMTGMAGRRCPAGQ
jgi:hypothetical protein